MNVSLCVFPLFSANKGLDDVIVSVFIRIEGTDMEPLGYGVVIIL